MNSGTIARLILIALVFLLLSAAQVSAQTTFSVSSSSACTLANAITAANTDTATGSCAAGSGADIINITGTITLTADLPAITSTITINGSGANPTIDGNDSHRAFNLNTSTTNVTINDLTLTQMQAPAGLAGGAINLWSASLTLNRVTIRDSEAWHSGSARGGGALVCAGSTLVIRDSSIFNNVGDEGGGLIIDAQCTVTITRSAIYNNRSRGQGGGINISYSSTLTINHSSIYGNQAGTGGNPRDGRGSGIYIVGTNAESALTPGNIRLNHVTITGNEQKEDSPDGTEGALHVVLGNVQLHVQNSIIYGNTNGRQCSRTLASVSQLSANVGNIIGSGNCGTPTGVFGSGGNPQLPASPTGSPPYFALSQSSPAVDAVDCISGLNQDQRGLPRPSPAGGRCDIGAYEHQYPPPPQAPAPPSDDTGGSGGDGGGVGGGGDAIEGDDEYSAPPVSTCLTLDGIAAYNLSESTQCQRVNAMQIANPNIKEGDFVDAVDVWSWVMPNTQICFEASGGSFTFIDTAAMPRTVQAWPACSLNGMTCGAINGPGMLVLLPGDPPPACVVQRPAAQAAPVSAQSLSNCMVRTQFNLNLRAAPDGEITGGVPHNATLTALERTAAWFKVDYHGERGWISAEYVDEKGTCG